MSMMASPGCASTSKPESRCVLAAIACAADAEQVDSRKLLQDTGSWRDDIALYRALAGGATTVRVLHGSANAIGGQDAIIKLKWGRTADELRFPEYGVLAHHGHRNDDICHDPGQGPSFSDLFCPELIVRATLGIVRLFVGDDPADRGENLLHRWLLLLSRLGRHVTTSSKLVANSRSDGPRFSPH